VRTIITRVRVAAFAERMTAMRVWLDEHRFEPAKFTYADDGKDVLIRVEFAADEEAAVFSARFNGGDSEPADDAELTAGVSAS
jgi:hypothetical protein